MRDFLYHNFNVPNALDLTISRVRGKDPDSFAPSGLTCFCGKQGSGKTLSAVLYVRKLMEMFPKSIVVSNVSLSSAFDTSRVLSYQGVKQMHDINNGKFGVIFLLDEIQIEFNSLESKQMNTPIFELVCQQRKQRKHIVGTTQVFGRLAKPFREQFREVVLCENYLKTIFVQKVFSAENIATDEDVTVQLSPKGTKVFIPSPDDFLLYDTLEQIKRVRKEF